MYMKQIILAAGVIAALGIFVVLILNVADQLKLTQMGEEDPQRISADIEEVPTNVETQYGFSFVYPAGDDAYTLLIPEDGVSKDLVFTQSLFSTEALENVPLNSEYPPSLVMEVYRNPMHTELEQWIKETERSNFSLSVDGTLEKRQLGATEYVVYTHDGLYRTDVYAYAQEGFVYLFSNMWNDPESGQKEDMEEVISSVVWSMPLIPAQVAHGDIAVSAPAIKASISSPLRVEGVARGTWFFEGSFPLTLVNWNGLIIAEGYAQAQGDWMTEDRVPWVGEIEFTKPEFDERGYLILQKDNPSGEPQFDDSIEIPIIFE